MQAHSERCVQDMRKTVLQMRVTPQIELPERAVERAAAQGCRAFIRSAALGRPSWILSTVSACTPASCSAAAVPRVATMPKPSACASLGRRVRAPEPRQGRHRPLLPCDL